MFYRYRFEAEIYPTLSRIPLHVRMKLDSTGVKISLKSWLAFGFEERRALCHLPVETEEEKSVFCAYVDFLSTRYLGEAAARVAAMSDPPWENRGSIPDSVLLKSKQSEPEVTPDEWRQWNIYQRYALFKLSVSNNEPEAFHETLLEFREGKRHLS